MTLHAKHESSSPYGLGQEDFERFFFQLPWQSRVLHGIHIFEVF